MIEGVRIRPAAGAVAARLAAIGQGTISSPVDATNHVLWDIGQPLHAFDLDTLAKGADGLPTIVVRRAKAGETLVTLDGVDTMLSTPQHLVIADAEKPVALAGVMGGLATAISGRTTRILLESAHFHPGAVRRTARSLGMHTDASHRFERGTDPEATVDGLNRAARLILADCGGAVAAGVLDERAGAPAAVRLTASSRAPRGVSRDVDSDGPRESKSSTNWASRRRRAAGSSRVAVPSWRVDVTCEEDLVEEVIRCEGYDSLPETLPAPFVPRTLSRAAQVPDRARDLLAGMGLLECQTYSFVSEAENAPFASAAPGAPVHVENPLGEPFTTLRATPVIGLLQSAQHNVRRGNRDLALFEVGPASDGIRRRERKKKTKSRFLLKRRPRRRVSEKGRVGILLAGARSRHWSQTDAANRIGFLRRGGCRRSAHEGTRLGRRLGPITFKEISSSSSSSSSSLVPRPGARRLDRGGGVRCGWVGVLEPSLAASVGPRRPRRRRSRSRRPRRRAASGRDVRRAAVEVSRQRGGPHGHARALDALARAGVGRPHGAPAELLAIEAKGRYRGPGVPDGFVKTTLTLRFGSPRGSLAREDVNGWRDAAARRLLALPGAKVDGVPAPA